MQNIKFYCKQKDVRPTVACKMAGVGQSFINNIEARGQVPSVEKVQQLAQYLGVTTSELLGETSPTGELVLRDSAVVVQPTDVQRLTVAEVEMVLAYRRASPDRRQIVDLALGGAKSTTSDVG